MAKPISSSQLMKRLCKTLAWLPHEVGAVTGPGRSGAIASSFASHLLGVPFIPFGQPCPPKLRPILIIDTAIKTGRTLRKAAAQYSPGCIALAAFNEPPRVRFWYETFKVAHGSKHER